MTRIKDDWDVVRQWRDQARRGMVTAWAAGHVTDQLRALAHAALLLLAFAALEGLLNQLREDGIFSTRREHPGLDELLKASRGTLQWANFDGVLEAKRARDDLAHHFLVPRAQDVIRHIDVVERELEALGYLPPAQG